MNQLREKKKYSKTYQADFTRKKNENEQNY